MPDDRFTSTEIIKVLLMEYDRRRTDDDTSKSMEALQADKGSKGPKSNKTLNKSNVDKITICFNCRKPGHYARNCRYKSGNKQTQHYKNNKRDLDTFLVSLNNLDIEESWLLDSGCTYASCVQKTGFKISGK